MTTQIIVVEDIAEWNIEGVACPAVDVDDYLTSEEYFNLKNTQVINLCKDYSYLSVGHYCSLLAEARRHRVIPSVKTMLDLSSKAMYSLDISDLDKSIQRCFKKHRQTDDKRFEMKVFFGQCQYEALSDLARQIFEIIPCPLLNVSFQHQGKWHIASIKAVPIKKLNADERSQFLDALNGYLKRPWRSPRKSAPSRYDMAILYNPDDPLPPSDSRALQLFVKAGRQLGIEVDLITKKDYARLSEYDALFIRDTTRINHYTYRFSKKAESEGMVVMDDPNSILRCTNKVYLAELLRSNRVPTPRTVIVGKSDLAAAEQAIGFPMVLKVPDGSFSQGVFKVENRDQFVETTQKLFKHSELILAQEFLYTEFDWRIGVLNQKPIFACQYYMSKKHWQIVKYDDKGKAQQGAFKTWAIAETPVEVVNTAVKAANLIGDGLYGVDVKKTDKGVYIIEVNDNPNLDAGVEDAYLKGQLYDLIMSEFLRRLEQRHGR